MAMNFDDALVIVHTYAVAAKQGMKEELITTEDNRQPLDPAIVDEAFAVVGERAMKHVSEAKVKKRK